MWQRARSASKNGFDRAWGWADKLGAPVNNLSNKLGSEAFWPTTMDKECEKAARILRSFCKDGFQAVEDEPLPEAEGAQGDRPVGVPRKNHTMVLKRIPAEVIRNAKGLAIFTTMRTGLWVSGAGGSGVLMARLPDGSWSCPSGIMLHTAGVGFLVGIDIYDCVMVLNTDEAVAAFSKIRCTVGGELSAVAGPIGVGGVLDSEVHARQAPIFTYLKSRGFYAGVQLDGTIIIERTDENERFYGRRIPVADILAGRVSLKPIETQRLLQTVKMAQGDTDVDVSMLSVESAPSDFDIASGQVFGVPAREDPDPYGVHALEEQGLVIREAGTKEVASPENFQFMPSPTSPLFGAFKHGQNWGQVGDGANSARSSWRTSLSLGSPKLSSTVVDVPESSSRPHSATFASKMAGIPEVDSIDQKLTQSVPDNIGTIDTTKAASCDVDSPRSAKSETSTVADTKPAKKSKPPPLPPRQTAASRILQEQLALAGQLRELISPTNSERNTSVPNTPTMQFFDPDGKSRSGESPVAAVISDKSADQSFETITSALDLDAAPALHDRQTLNHEALESDIETRSPSTPVKRPNEPEIIDADRPAGIEVPAIEPEIIAAEHELPPSDREDGADADDEDSDWSSDDENVVFHEVVTATNPRMGAASPQLISKPRLVNVTIPTTPALPSRNPNRVRQSSTPDIHSVQAIDAVVSQDELSLLEHYRPSSRTSSIYSAKEEILSSTKGSDSLASVSSADNADGLGLSAVEFQAPSTVMSEK